MICYVSHDSGIHSTICTTRAVNLDGMLCHLAAATPGVFDYVVVNEEVEPAFSDLCKVLKEVRCVCTCVWVCCAVYVHVCK